MALQYKKTITIDNTNVDADLTSFPLLVRITDDTDLGQYADVSGSDLRFGETDAFETGNYYYHDIQQFKVSDNTASALIWVNVPLISSSAATDIYMFYGDAELTDISSGSAVFDSYEMVLRAESGSTTISDISNGPISAWTSEAGLVTADGIIETALDPGAGFIYSSDSTSANTLWGGLETASFSMWMTRTTADANPYFDNESGGMWMWTDSDTGYVGFDGSFYGLGSSYTDQSESEPGLFSPTGSWVHYVYTRISSSIRVYKDGQFFEAFTSSLAAHPSTTGRFGLGTFAFGGNRWNGPVEDPRISHDQKSDAWIKFEYENVASGSIAIGAQQVASITGLPIPSIGINNFGRLAIMNPDQGSPFTIG